MTKSQIEEQRVLFENHFNGANFTRLFGGDYIPEVSALFRGWLAAKQDEKNTKVGDSIETPSGLFQVMKHPDSVDDSGIANDGLIRSYCAYCGSGNHDHLPNCKGARR